MFLMSLQVIAISINSAGEINGCGKTQTTAAWHPWPVLVVLARSSHFRTVACCAINIHISLQFGRYQVVSCNTCMPRKVSSAGLPKGRSHGARPAQRISGAQAH